MSLGLALGLAATACSSDDDDGGDGLGGDGPPMMTADGPIPLEGGNALLDWLEGRGYFAWEGESGPHGSAGPHFGDVRTYLEPSLVDSLAAEEAAHPAGAAAVKELYGDGNTVLGWAVSIKRADDSDGGNGWYWLEVFDGSTFADGDGAGVCTGCHSGGTDFVLSPFPLQ